MEISRWRCWMLKLEDFANWYNNVEKIHGIFDEIDDDWKLDVKTEKFFVITI